MKLLYCPKCNDVFNLTLRLKQCSCGETKGKYINNLEAEVNGNGYSLAIGNGSLFASLQKSADMKEDWRDKSGPWVVHDTSIICWSRPHEGPANPHTTVNKNL